MLFSIITVCFNSAKTIRQTFDSVLQQEFKDYEYIVVDGASTDGTVDIIKEYEPKFEGRMRWISEPDKGIYDAMNKGAGMAYGDYLYFLNSDDALELGVFANVAGKIDRMQVDVFFGMVRGIGDDGREMYVSRTHPNAITTIGHSLCHQGIFEKRNSFLANGGFNTKYRIYADLAHMLKLKSIGAVFVPLDGIIAAYKTTGISSRPDYRERMQVYVDAGLMPQNTMECILRQEAREKRCMKCFHFFLGVFARFLRPFKKH